MSDRMSRRRSIKQRAIEEEEKERGVKFYTEKDLKSVGMKKHIHYDCDDTSCRTCHGEPDEDENTPTY